MPTEQSMLGREGFTLIEVLIAMLILAVGLLGLEALGIGAARALAGAEHRNEVVAAATGAMEEGQQRVRQAPTAVATGESCESVGVVQVCTDVQTRATLPSLPPGSARVQVRATRATGSVPTYTIGSYVFDPALP